MPLEDRWRTLNDVANEDPKKQGVEGILTPEQFDRWWNSVARYFKRKPFRATAYSLILMVVFGAPWIGWLREHGKSEDLNEQVRDLKTEKSSLQTRYDNLETTVAPIMRQAAKEFPGEAINESLKKVVARLEARPAYSIFLNDVRLGPVNVLQIPKAVSSRLSFSVENVGTAESRDLRFALTMPARATNHLSGWIVSDKTFLVHTNRIEPHPGFVIFNNSMHGRVSVGRIASFDDLTIKPLPEIIVLGMFLKVEGDGVDEANSRLWVILGDDDQANSIVLTGQEAMEALNRVAPRILEAGKGVAKSIWR